MLRILDSFSGAGGFSKGFEMAGATTIGAIEIDKWAVDTFQYNNPDSTVLHGDISKIKNEELMKKFGKLKPNVIIGGPPCQGFSHANVNNKDEKDPRNSLFKHFIRLGKIFNPDLMIMENVPTLLKTRTKNGALVGDIITQELELLNYKVYVRILNAADFGVPQVRNRLFIIASKNDLANPFPEPTHSQIKGNKHGLLPTPTLWEAISDLPELEAREGFEESIYTHKPRNNYQKLLRNDSSLLFNHKAMNHTPRMVQRFASMNIGDTVADVPHHLKPRARNTFEVSGKIYEQNNRRLDPNKPSNTIPASFYANFVHPFQNRNFTAREGARIQSFPDTYKFLGKPTVVSHKLLAREGRAEEKYLCQYAQIGNAVPPLLAKAIASNLMEQI